MFDSEDTKNNSRFTISNYAYIESIDCILWSLLALNTIILTSSVYIYAFES